MDINFCIKSLEHFRDAWDLLESYGHPVIDDLTPDVIRFIKAADDFEPLAYFVANYETVIIGDSINGDIFCIESISEFIAETVADATREAEEERRMEEA